MDGISLASQQNSHWPCPLTIWSSWCIWSRRLDNDTLLFPQSSLTDAMVMIQHRGDAVKPEAVEAVLLHPPAQV